ncbi:MAG: hypothetical protein LBG42_04875 [Treponema sp.]|jgi:hypothetical protein|nr:hypothetical protein [Treponema sp.]
MTNLKNGLVKKLLPVLGVTFLLFACATKPDVYKEIDEAVGAASFGDALAAIEKGQAAKKPIYPENNAVLLYLDKGNLEHYAERHAESSTDLDEAERLIREAYTQSVTADIASYFANDNTKEYAGEDYEDIYTNIFRALNYYHNGEIDNAAALINGATDKIKALEGKYTVKEDSAIRPELITAFIADAVGIACKAAGLPGFLVPVPEEILKPNPEAAPFENSALAKYLEVIFTRYVEGRREWADLALTDIKNLGKTFPSLNDEKVEAIPAGKARLNFIGFTGLSPAKVEKIEDLDLFFFPALSALRPIDNEKMRLTYGNLALPSLEPRPSVIDSVEIDVNGQKVTLDLLEDIGDVTEKVFGVKYPSIRTKTYIRALIKYIAVEVAAQVAVGQGLPQLAVIAAATAAKKGVDASEKADIRGGRYLPGKAWVGGLTLDPGTYDVTFTFSNGDTVTKNITVQANKANIVEAFSLK